MSLRGNVHVYLGCTKTRSPEFGTVLHWRPPDVHILDTDPSLLQTQLMPSKWKRCYHGLKRGHIQKVFNYFNIGPTEKHMAVQ